MDPDRERTAGRKRPPSRGRALVARALGARADASAARLFWALFFNPDPPRKSHLLRHRLLCALGLACLPPLRALAGLLRWLARDVVKPILVLTFWPLALLLRAANWLASWLRWPAIAGERALRRSVLPRAVVVLLVLLALPAVVLAVTMPLDLRGQLYFLLALLLPSLVVRRIRGRWPVFVLAAASLLAMARYAWWRVFHTLEFDSALEATLGYVLLIAEAYTWVIAVLGMLQMIAPRRRHVQPLQGPRGEWPTVDVFIPTYNEPLEVLRTTVLAAKSMDWPRGRMAVWVLDDGARGAVRDFAHDAGVGYLSRPTHEHAKAGNLNWALRHTRGELIAVFDCDHIPVRSFLTSTVGWLQRDAGCAVVQTPHSFYSPDPIEHNLDTEGTIPPESELFHRLIQDGNDFWNASFFCGSCAVLRRSALERVGGFATATVTEDAHTALRLHRAGYRSAYINLPLSAGLATDNLASHVRQRVRWARGMAQIFRVDNPLLGRGLSVAQRLCYLNAMLHFFHGLPRLVFIVAPMAYLFLRLRIFHASAAMAAAYVLPYLLQSVIAGARIQGHWRRSFWGEVYETVLACYIALPTTLALIVPSWGRFNVTAKGGATREAYFDWRIALPYAALALLSLAAAAEGVRRLVDGSGDASTLWLNLVWISCAIVPLGAGLGAARESVRPAAPRVRATVPLTLTLAGGAPRGVRCRAFSARAVFVERAPALPPDGPVGVQLEGASGRVMWGQLQPTDAEGLREIRFGTLSLADEQALVAGTFGRPDLWMQKRAARGPEAPLASLADVLRASLLGYERALRALVPARGRHAAGSSRAVPRPSEERP